MKWLGVSGPPAVMIFPSPAITSVPAPTTIPGDTPAMRSGLPALPTATMRPSRMPMSAFTIPQWSTMTALVTTTSDADVGLHDPPVVHDDGVGDDDVEDAVGPGRPCRLTHPVADHLATAELRLLTSHGQVALDADQELGVGETHAVAGRRTVEIGVLTPRQAQAHGSRSSHAASRASACSLSAPSVSALSPKTRRAPASSTSVTRFSSPGSKRTAVPAGPVRGTPDARGGADGCARVPPEEGEGGTALQRAA